MISALPTRVAPGPADLGRLRAGGSSWTYLDLVDERGDGLVLILSAGLPFLPGYVSATREGRPADPLDHRALVLSTIRGGRPDFYALHRLPREGLPGTFQITAEDGIFRLEADLRGTLPGCAWEARIDVVGAARRPSLGEPLSAPHEWSVWCAGAEATAVLRAGTTEQRFAGRAYVDRNLCEGTLETAGLASWHWGRVALPDGDLVWYAAEGADGEPRGAIVHLGRDGETTELPEAPRTSGSRRGRWGLVRPAVVHLPGLDLALDHPIDDSEPYTRLLLWSGGRAVGFAEACRTDRIDRRWMRPLTRMVVTEDRSPWLPLFCGPREGRIGRLFRTIGRAS